MAQLPTELTWWAWAVKGLGGIVAIIDEMSVNGPRISEYYHTELTKAVAQLARVVDRLGDRRLDLGAEHAEPTAGPTDPTGDPDYQRSNRHHWWNR